ncbi:MAG: UDP-N-acetylglucosamine--N-acetylmuramyl-(pentapeptide) pyrophosphoryl-undecaprenol N-acetylglucosamine transferase, partial [Alphaproteobacteria bacterium]|nr:UDP-N-acetylglucosamine--N-acetylmuramyl-(pentapeptide) pyrophosphoryl-undecaprenol N-acetylglucosamine transferase [Alphaproteobacteria bacterium]
GLHEQNAIMGKANVFLAFKAKFIALSFPLPEGMNFSARVTSKASVIGNLVRPEIVALKEASYPALEKETPLHIFVMGGSLGATVFSHVIPEALSLLSHEQKKQLRIVQQCREADLKEAINFYEKSGIASEHITLAPFFDDVDEKLSWAHLFIGRSGASTVAEMSIAGCPAIYVPYPHHKDQQQKRNAMSVVDKGGAWLIEEKNFTLEAVKGNMIEFLDNPQILRNAAMRAKECGRADAAECLAKLSLKIINNK